MYVNDVVSFIFNGEFSFLRGQLYISLFKVKLSILRYYKRKVEEFIDVFLNLFVFGQFKELKLFILLEFERLNFDVELKDKILKLYGEIFDNNFKL